jgi:hypothetical protein
LDADSGLVFKSYLSIHAGGEPFWGTDVEEKKGEEKHKAKDEEKR